MGVLANRLSTMVREAAAAVPNPSLSLLGPYRRRIVPAVRGAMDAPLGTVILMLLDQHCD